MSGYVSSNCNQSINQPTNQSINNRLMKKFPTDTAAIGLTISNRDLRPDLNAIVTVVSRILLLLVLLSPTEERKEKFQKGSLVLLPI